jgi:hypothetical protein
VRVEGGIDDEQIAVPPRDPLHQLERPAHMVEKPEAENDVEGLLLREVEGENVGLLEPITARVDALCLEDEARLLEMHRATVDAQDEVRAGLDSRERPESRITPEIEHALAGE